jgi:hypothetical protein
MRPVQGKTPIQLYQNNYGSHENYLTRPQCGGGASGLEQQPNGQWR